MDIQYSKGIFNMNIQYGYSIFKMVYSIWIFSMKIDIQYENGAHMT